MSYPLHDKRIQLESGTTIRFYNLMIDISPGPASMHVQYDTEIPASDVDARVREAREVVMHFADTARREGARRAFAGICSTMAQAATTEIPEQIFQFEFEEDNSWKFLGIVQP